MMASDYEHRDGQFFFVQWEAFPSFLYGSWRSDMVALRETVHGFLHCSPSRLIVLKVVQASSQDEQRLTTKLNALTTVKWPLVSQWRDNNAAIQAFIRELPCSTRQARAVIGHCEGRLLWRPNDEKQTMRSAKEVIIELLGRSELPCAPATLHALPGAAIPLQTIYNTLLRLLDTGLVRRPEKGLYELTEGGRAFYGKLIRISPPRKSVRSLVP
jgi:predicted transcriptional regulator